ncbi:conserved hypothetical protein [Neospora caninum Liverpool]|uniref:Transmembrane protein n=1 Tax=Neospora caninum (strain Liverpool) TaxID=572307 RepID=F0VCB1_NEOCL|nr:conserved hypothetical protein [Neospora caninum Liverpool]CBZ51245.1 conserved hypothetical protein [Neospora caninum Liverpool]CEL68560.1 TPA: hypothetical protein BN1204_043130 [Neospora caninum Liverpool]|eukprot:XP_003881278.1 conserved hypothetical protein [Neospora caninum Liverpool]
MYCRLPQWGGEGRRRSLRALLFFCALLAFSSVTAQLVSASHANEHSVSATESVVTEAEGATHQEEAAEERADSWDDAVENPDALATALMQRIQELYLEGFRLIASAKGHAAAFTDELQAHLHKSRQGASSENPLQIRSLGGIQLSWLEADKTRREARVVLKKLMALLGQLKAVAKSVGVALQTTVNHAVRQGQSLYGILSKTLTKDEKRGEADLSIQMELRKGSF